MTKAPARNRTSGRATAGNGASGPEGWPAARVEMWELARIKPYERNPKSHPDAQIALIAKSMADDGVTQPILVDEVGVILAGHGRRLGALKNGFTHYPVVVARGWTDERKRAARIRDNSLAGMAPWNPELLKLEILDLKMAGYSVPLLGFTEVQLRGFGISAGTEVVDPEETPPVPAKPVSRLGDLWLMGKHRLLAGDSTKAEDVARALGGEKPHLMVTDPPFGVNYDPNWRSTPGNAKSLRHPKKGAVGKVNNDHKADWRAAWSLFPGDVVYCWSADLRSSDVVRSLEESNFKLRAQIIWAKSHFAIGRGDYHFQHEPCWYAVREGGRSRWCGDRKQTTLWHIALNNRSESGHSTQKPVECMRRPIENNSRAGDAVYEPFCGSGTLIVAAEMTGRRALAVEIDPAYVDVSVERIQKITGQEAILDGTTKTFAQVKAERLKAEKNPVRVGARAGSSRGTVPRASGGRAAKRVQPAQP